MTPTHMRKIVKIDEDKCTGCGLCVPSCAEGAIQIVDGKAHLVADNLCDGLGNCLGECPEGAITIEQRPAEAFDVKAVRAHKAGPKAPMPRGCPSTMARTLSAGAAAATPQAPTATEPLRPSRLGHWPVQLALVPVAGEMWRDADVLIAADCVAYALGDFHERLLAGRSLAVACPKLDDVDPYIEKLTRVFAGNDIRSVTVAHMEVPCCGGLVSLVREALARAGRDDLELIDITVGVDGSIARGGRTVRHELVNERS